MISPDNISQVLAETPVDDIWGIGRRTYGKLEQLGIRTALDLAHADSSYLRKKFSINLVRTSYELQGIPAITFEDAPPPRQSVSSSKSFSTPVTREDHLKEAAISYTATTAEKMRKDHGVTVAGGQGKLKGKIIRIGHLGAITKEDLYVTLEALKSVLDEMGWKTIRVQKSKGLKVQKV